MAADKPRLPNYERLPFESVALRLASLDPNIVSVARLDFMAVPAWSATDRGGFRRLLACKPEGQKRARALIGSTLAPEVPRLIQQFSGEPAAFGFVARDQVQSSPTSPGGATPTSPAHNPSASTTHEGLPATGTPPVEFRAGQPGPSESPATIPVPIQTPPVGAVVPQPAPTALPSPPQFTPVPLPPPAPAPIPTATPIESLVLTLNPPGPIVHGDNMRPGDSVVGTVTVGNAGTLPFVYSMSVKGGSGPLWDDYVHGLQLCVLRLSDNAILYAGPLAASTGPLGGLAPGERKTLALQVSLPPAAGDVMQGASVTVDFVFTAIPVP